ncbi:MAG TPA: hypothetical protein VFJ58_06870 [Armatimonadota bacterium]|nr:hypothetical protein [Armatimonadota bacterium]
MSDDENLQKAASQYRNDGYTVTIRPADNDLPSFLTGYRPDLIARKGDDTAVVAVTTRDDLMKRDELAYTAAAVNAQTGWRFDVVVVADAAWPDPVSHRSSEPTLAQIRGLSLEAEQLAAQRHVEAAILIAWSAAEAALRRLASFSSIGIERMDAQFVMKTLYSQGILSHSDYERLQAWARVRNTLAHGLRGARVDHRIPSAIRDWLERILTSEASAAA